MTKKQKQQILKSLAGSRGIERKQHFANGGSVSDWMGGPHLVTKNKKKAKNKKACRGKIRC